MEQFIRFVLFLIATLSFHPGDESWVECALISSKGFSQWYFWATWIVNIKRPLQCIEIMTHECICYCRRDYKLPFTLSSLAMSRIHVFKSVISSLSLQEHLFDFWPKKFCRNEEIHYFSFAITCILWIDSLSELCVIRWDNEINWILLWQFQYKCADKLLNFGKYAFKWRFNK